MLLLNRNALHSPLPAFLTSYLADALALPVILTLALAVQRRLGNHPPGFVFPNSWLLAAWLFVSVWFEAVLPHYSTRATADPLDVLAYAAGTLVFAQWLNRAP
jgi:hypothetical protein